MTFSVYHVGLDLELNLSEPDLGHPSMPGLWEMLRADKRPVPERQLQCMQCRDARPDCPEWMFLSERGGVRFATHHNTTIGDHPSNESDQHKALKERIAKAAERGGFSVEVEDRAGHGRRRTDVLVRGVGDIRVGHEVQLSYASLASVKKRTRVAMDDGITPLWTTVDPKRDFINQVPWARTADLPWKYIVKDEELEIRGGVRALEMERCDLRNPMPCPVRGHGRCGQLHGKWVSALGYRLDDLVRDTAAGVYVPVVIVGKRMKLRWWVRAEDRDRFVDSGGQVLAEDDLRRRREPAADGSIPRSRPIDPKCRYGQDSGYRSPPAEVQDDGSPVDASVVTVPTTPAAVPPPFRARRPGVCGAGAGPCGRSPARLYACGWRCAEHRP